MSRSHTVICTAGHIDHGKSSLIIRLTGIDPDRLPEEKARGMTIDIGFAHYDTPDGKRILTSDHLLEIDHVPVSMVVLGAGAVGVELASVMQDFGCRVTLVELMERVLPLEDPDCSEEVVRALKRQGMIVRNESRI